MRRAAAALSALLLLAPAGHAQTRRAEPPHAWLFGSWTGGLFPVLNDALAQDCRAQPTVVFAQDLVNHASLIGETMAERIIETVRVTPGGAEFRFTPDSDDPAGFGCPDTNGLVVQRTSETEITFPKCAAFPYPLHRCPG